MNRHSYIKEAWETMDNDLILVAFEHELQINDRDTAWQMNHGMISAEEIGDILNGVTGDEYIAEVIATCRKEIGAPGKSRQGRKNDE